MRDVRPARGRRSTMALPPRLRLARFVNAASGRRSLICSLSPRSSSTKLVRHSRPPRVVTVGGGMSIARGPPFASSRARLRTCSYRISPVGMLKAFRTWAVSTASSNVMTPLQLAGICPSHPAVSPATALSAIVPLSIAASPRAPPSAVPPPPPRAMPPVPPSAPPPEPATTLPPSRPPALVPVPPPWPTVPPLPRPAVPPVPVTPPVPPAPPVESMASAQLPSIGAEVPRECAESPQPLA